MLKLVLLFFVALLGLSGLSSTLRAQDFGGGYTVAAPEGPMALALHQDADGFVTGTLAAPGGVTFQVEGVVLVDDEDDASVEGTLTGPRGGGDFTFYADDEGDGYSLLITPYDASGTPRPDLAAEYAARRGEGIASETTVDPRRQQDAGTQSVGPPPGDAGRDARLVGVWTTQVNMVSDVGSVATQLVMEIRADGLLVDRGARSMGSFPDAGLDTGPGGGGEAAAWRTQGNTLLVSYAGSPWVPLARFEVSGNRLLLAYYDGDRTLWHRQ